jgi:hypothetical protein
VFLLRYPEGVSIEEGDRWYLGTHTQEAKKQPGLQHYRTWKGLSAPEGVPGRPVEVLNRWVRLTELGYPDWDTWREAIIRHPLSYTPAPWAKPDQVTRGTSASFIAETLFIGDHPDRDMLAGTAPTSDGAKIRMIFFLRYPDEVPIEDGERWYFDVHTEEAKRQAGLVRYRTWKALPAPEGVPGRPLEALNRWVRLSELGYPSWDAWRESIVTNALPYTAAPWADPAKVQRGASASYISEIILLGDTPQYDLLREVPSIP